jgi:transcriptional regulator with XRE-family HTH domain
MSNTGVYMNTATNELKKKGYTLTEGLKKLGISLSTYRRWEKPDALCNEVLIAWIDKLECK